MPKSWGAGNIQEKIMFFVLWKFRKNY
jgi:hypothetical protein